LNTKQELPNKSGESGTAVGIFRGNTGQKTPKLIYQRQGFCLILWVRSVGCRIKFGHFGQHSHFLHGQYSIHIEQDYEAPSDLAHPRDEVGPDPCTEGGSCLNLGSGNLQHFRNRIHHHSQFLLDPLILHFNNHNTGAPVNSTCWASESRRTINNRYQAASQIDHAFNETRHHGYRGYVGVLDDFPYLANSYSEHFLAQRESQVLLSFNACRLEGTAYRQAAGHGFLLETLELSFANVLAGDDFRRARPEYWPGFHRSRCFVRCWFLPLDLEEAHELL